MVFFQVGVVVIAGGEHEIDVMGEPFIRIVAAVFLGEFHEFPGELEVEGVFTGCEELMVVDAALSPILCLIVEDLALFIEGCVFGAPEDGTGVRVLRSEIGGDFPILGAEGFAVVIPVYGHGGGICDEGAEVGVLEGGHGG